MALTSFELAFRAFVDASGAVPASPDTAPQSDSGSDGEPADDTGQFCTRPCRVTLEKLPLTSHLTGDVTDDVTVSDDGGGDASLSVVQIKSEKINSDDVCELGRASSPQLPQSPDSGRQQQSGALRRRRANITYRISSSSSGSDSSDNDWCPQPQSAESGSSDGEIEIIEPRCAPPSRDMSLSRPGRQSTVADGSPATDTPPSSVLLQQQQQQPRIAVLTQDQQQQPRLRLLTQHQQQLLHLIWQNKPNSTPQQQQQELIQQQQEPTQQQQQHIPNQEQQQQQKPTQEQQQQQQEPTQEQQQHQQEPTQEQQQHQQEPTQEQQQHQQEPTQEQQQQEQEPTQEQQQEKEPAQQQKQEQEPAQEQQQEKEPAQQQQQLLQLIWQQKQHLTQQQQQEEEHSEQHQEPTQEQQQQQGPTQEQQQQELTQQHQQQQEPSVQQQQQQQRLETVQSHSTQITPTGSYTTFYKQRQLRPTVLQQQQLQRLQQRVQEGQCAGKKVKRTPPPLPVPDRIMVLDFNGQDRAEVSTGDFVINLFDLNQHYPPIWRVQSSTLLERYNVTSKEEWPRKRCYESQMTYVSLLLSGGECFRKVKVIKVVRPRTYVLLSDDIHDSGLCVAKSDSLKASENYLANFEVFMQTLISQVLDENFLKEVSEDQDEYFVNNLSVIGQVNKEHIDRLVLIRPWSDVFQSLLETFSQINMTEQSYSQWSSCLFCHRRSSLFLVALGGGLYDPLTLRLVKSAPTRATTKSHILCFVCVRLAVLYSQMKHLEFRLFGVCDQRVKSFQYQWPEEDSRVILTTLLEDVDWIHKNFDQTRTIWADVDLMYSLLKKENEDK